MKLFLQMLFLITTLELQRYKTMILHTPVVINASLKYMDVGFATFLAAIIAALASLVSLVYRKDFESKAAYRKVLDSILNDLSEAIHETVATSNIIVKTSTKEGLKNWSAKADNAKKKLKVLTYRTRYSLYGLEDGMRTLSRLPDWAEHKRNIPNEINPLLKKAGRLKYWLDYSIRKSYFRGTSPNSFQKMMVNYSAYSLRKAYNRNQNKN